MAKPATSEFLAYFKRYIDLVPEGDLTQQMANSHQAITQLFQKLPEQQLLFRYAEGKWTMKEVLVHLCDTERVFAYRALRIARKDKTPLPSYDENQFAQYSEANNRAIKDILREYTAIRTATIELFKSFSEVQLSEIGTASGHPLSARAAGYVIAGHDLHHLNIIKERYLWHTSDIVFV